MKLKSVILFVLSVLAMFCIAREPSVVLYPPIQNASYNLNVYHNYYIFSDNRNPFEEMVEVDMEIMFLDDFQVYVLHNNGKERIGQWRVSNDTLLIYQDWSQWHNKDIELAIINNPDIVYDIRAESGFLHKRNIYDDSFPRNVSAFKIINHGDSLIALSDERKRKAIAISKKAANEMHRYHWLDSVHFIPEDWLDTLVWKPEIMPESNLYKVNEITKADTNVISVTVLNSDIEFNILNPILYPQMEALPYAERREYCDWIDRVKVGDTISLELTRPAYEQEVFDRSPYLRGYPDAIYVLDNEAYGYWFAKPVYNNR